VRPVKGGGELLAYRRYGAARSFGIPNLNVVLAVHSMNEGAVVKFFYGQRCIPNSHIEENQFLFGVWLEPSSGIDLKSELPPC
jgi:hypothetical protein